jgi:hypothetical protein
MWFLRNVERVKDAGLTASPDVAIYKTSELCRQFQERLNILWGDRTDFCYDEIPILAPPHRGIALAQNGLSFGVEQELDIVLVAA